MRSGQLGERGLPVVTHLFAPRADGRAVATGHRPTPEVQARLADVGFSPDWLQPGLSDWDTHRNTSRASSGRTRDPRRRTHRVGGMLVLTGLVVAATDLGIGWAPRRGNRRTLTVPRRAIARPWSASSCCC